VVDIWVLRLVKINSIPRPRIVSTSIKGANNIDHGVLIVLSNLTSIEFSPNKKSVLLGADFTWGEVYSYLQKYDLTVGGGRLSPAGVPGLLLEVASTSMATSMASVPTRSRDMRLCSQAERLCMRSR